MLKKILLFYVTVCFICCQNNSSQTKEKEITENFYEEAVLVSNTNNALKSVDSLNKVLPLKSMWNKLYYYYHKAWLYNKIGKYNLSIAYTDSTLNFIHEHSLQKVAPYEYLEMYDQKGIAFFNLSNYAKAYENYFKANQLAENSNNKCGSIFLKNNIGLVLYRQQEFTQAIKVFKTEIDVINSCTNFLITHNVNQGIEPLDNIALCFTKLKQYDSAKFYYNKALETLERQKPILSKESNKREEIYASCKGVILGNLAKVFLAQNSIDTAIILYKQAIYLNTVIGSEKYDAQLCQEQLAQVLLQKKEFAQLNGLLQNLKLSLDTLPNAHAKLGWYNAMANYYKSQNNYQQEIIYYKYYTSLKDSLNSANTGALQNTITNELKSKEQDLQITVLQKNNQLSKIYLWIVAFGCVLAALIASLVYRNYKKSKHLNKEINQQKDALQKANVEKDRILNVVAHDLRNPIGAIANFLDLAQIKFEHGEEEKEILKNSQQVALHSLNLINELLEVNQMQDGNIHLFLEEINIHSLLEKTIQQINHKALAKKQQVNYTINNTSIKVNVDVEKLQRVFINLLDNAIKFSYPETIILVDVCTNFDKVQIKIIDAGIGIPPNLLNQLFTTPLSTKRSGTNNEKSNGLGLSICKQIVEAHNGKIWAESQVGSGSSFFVELPKK